MKTTLIVLWGLVVMKSTAQTSHRISTYATVQYNLTLTDITTGNNPWGAGPGIQVFLNNKKKITAVAELTADAYLEDDKVLRYDLVSDVPTQTAGSMINLFGGIAYVPARMVYLSFTAGPSLTGGRLLAGIKPSAGFYFDRNQKWMGKISYISIFNRYKRTGQDFSSLSFAIGLKLF